MPTKKKAVRRASKVHAAASTYIDPLNCDSTVSYKIVTSNSRLWGSVQLADCTRKIDWYFRADRTSLVKVDRVIEALQAFRAEFAGAQCARRSRTIRKK